MTARPALASFLAVVLLAAFPVAGRAAPSADLAVRARAILAEHCTACHGEKPDRTTFAVLDHEQMVKTDRPALALELIESGSMPPGQHEKLSDEEINILRKWVAAGAVAYPRQYDDEFAYRTILADIETLTKANAASVSAVRYLSLHHLATEKTWDALSRGREDFLKGFRQVVKEGAPLPIPVDATETIFRFDLREAGWHHKPFKKIALNGDINGPADGNLFDLALLEYPFGVLPRGSATFDDLSTKFLKPAGQVRPIPFIRGDWFVNAVATKPFAEELGDLILPFQAIPPGILKPRPQVEASPLKLPVASATAVPIPAIDSLYGPDHSPVVPRGLVIGTFDFSFDRPRVKFSPGDKLRLRLKADDKLFYEMMWIDSDAKIATFTFVEKNEAGKTAELILPEKDDVLGVVLGKEKFLLFVSTREFTLCERWRPTVANKPIERTVHPIFKLEKKGELWLPSLADAGVARVTASIEIVARADKKK